MSLLFEPYADVEFADELVAFYAIYDEEHNWLEQDEGVKTAALTRATLAIDALEYDGVGFALERTSLLQFNAFPRGGDNYVPEKVKMACVFEAIELIKSSHHTRRSLMNDGVSQSRFGGSYESYGGTAGKLYSIDAQNMLLEFMEKKGVYPIS